MKSISILGIDVNPMTIPTMNALLGEAVSNERKIVLANHNLHSLYLFHRNHRLRLFYQQADLTHIDGMGIIILARILGIKLGTELRVTYVDWIRPLMSEAQDRGWKIFFVGSKPGVGEKACQVLRGEFPRLAIESHHGYFDIAPDSAENQAVVEQINQAKPDLLLVGMGMPRQEYWILDNLPVLDVAVVLPSGACMDYVAGATPTPPRWLGRVGLEWLYRLACEPKRLFSRYLVEPWFILRLLLKEILTGDARRKGGG